VSRIFHLAGLNIPHEIDQLARWRGIRAARLTPRAGAPTITIAYDFLAV